MRDGESVREDKPPPINTFLSVEGTRLVSSIIIAGRNIPATVDTGATSSFISEKLAASLQTESPSVPYAATVTLVDGSQRQVLEAVDSIFTFGNRRIRMRLLVMTDVTEDLILGLNFLTEVEVRITCAGLTCIFKVHPEQHRHQTMITADLTTDAQVRETSGYDTVSGVELKDQKRIRDFLEGELQKLSDICGPSTIATHKISMKDDRPFKLRYAPRNPAMQTIIEGKINELLAQGYIEPSRSPYSSPITLAKKKNGT